MSSEVESVTVTVLMNEYYYHLYVQMSCFDCLQADHSDTDIFGTVCICILCNMVLDAILTCAQKLT